jgi:15-cis-phytoene synthase
MLRSAASTNFAIEANIMAGGSNPSDVVAGSDDFAYCEDVVREVDKDRYLATLFAPADRRPALFALYAFNLEIIRVRDLVREALAGEVRLQWWREALAGEARGDVRAHPIANALVDTIARYKLPVDVLLRLIDAHGFDLYNDPMPSISELETYGRRTSSALVELASLIIAGDHDLGETAIHGGIAYAIAAVLRSLPNDAARSRLYVPLDLLERHGVRVEDVFARRSGEGLLAALAELRALALQHMTDLEEWRALVPPEVSPAFLPVALVPSLIARMERKTYDPFTPVQVPQWRRQWILWRAARKNFPSG